MRNWKGKAGALALVMLTACQPTTVIKDCAGKVVAIIPTPSGGSSNPKPPPTTVQSFPDCRIGVYPPRINSVQHLADYKVLGADVANGTLWRQRCNGRFVPIFPDGSGNKPEARIPATFHVNHDPIFGTGIGYWEAHPATMDRIALDLAYLTNSVHVTVVTP